MEVDLACAGLVNGCRTVASLLSDEDWMKVGSKRPAGAGDKRVPKGDGWAGHRVGPAGQLQCPHLSHHLVPRRRPLPRTRLSQLERVQSLWNGAGMSSDSMYSYSQFASGDALALAELVDINFKLEDVRKAFDAMSVEARLRFEFDNAEHILQIIRRTEGQRPAYMKRIAKAADATTCALVLVFAMLGLARVRTLIDMRDRFRLIRPGLGYRVTCEGIYQRQDFYTGSLGTLLDYGWPKHVFDEYSGDFSWVDRDALDDDDIELDSDDC